MGVIPSKKQWQRNKLNARHAKLRVHLVDITRSCFLDNEHTAKCSCFYHTCVFKISKVFSFMWLYKCLLPFQSWELIPQFVSSGMMELYKSVCWLWCPIVLKWSLWPQHVVAKVVPLWCHNLRLAKLCHNGCWTLTCALFWLDHKPNLCIILTWSLT